MVSNFFYNFFSFLIFHLFHLSQLFEVNLCFISILIYTFKTFYNFPIFLFRSSIWSRYIASKSFYWNNFFSPNWLFLVTAILLHFSPFFLQKDFDIFHELFLSSFFIVLIIFSWWIFRHLYTRKKNIRRHKNAAS